MQTLRISRAFRVPRIPRTAAVGAFAVALVASGITATAAGGAASMVDLQFVNVSDWHAQLDPLVVGTTQIGGAAVLSTYFKQERQANPNTITLTAGDAYGASPPLSGWRTQHKKFVITGLEPVTQPVRVGETKRLFVF